MTSSGIWRVRETRAHVTQGWINSSQGNDALYIMWPKSVSFTCQKQTKKATMSSSGSWTWMGIWKPASSHLYREWKMSGRIHSCSGQKRKAVILNLQLQQVIHGTASHAVQELFLQIIRRGVIFWIPAAFPAKRLSCFQEYLTWLCS